MHSLIQIVMDELFGVFILTDSLSYKSCKGRMALHPNDPIGDNVIRCRLPLNLHIPDPPPYKINHVF